MKNRTLVFEWASTLIVAAIIFCFFYFYAWGGMYCYSNEELFLLSTDFASQYLTYPSGFLQYAAKLFAQFLIVRSLGALVFAFLFVSLQRLVWSVASAFRKNHVYYLLSFLILDLFFFDNIVIRSKPLMSIACVINMALFLLIVKVKVARARFLIESLALFLTYWLTGGAFFVLMILLIVYEVRRYVIQKMYYEAFFCSVSILLIGLLYPCLAAYFSAWMFSEVLMFTNIVDGSSTIFYLFFVPALSLIIAYFPVLNFFRRIPIYVAQVVLVLLYLKMGMSSISQESEYMDRDVYYAFNSEWSKIVENSKLHKPVYMARSVISNMALQKCNKMADEFYVNAPTNYNMIYFPHNIEQRLNYNVCASAGIVAYELGLINLALEHFTEYNSSQITDNLNVLFLKYQIKIFIARGNYKVAEKLLKILKKTIFHKKWANEMSAYLYNDKKVMQNEELAKFRKMKYPDNLVYSMVETDVVLYTVFKANPWNRALYEYLLFEILRHRDLKDFAIVYDMGSKYNEYPKGIPLNFQQALSLYWVMAGKNIDEIPYYIEPQVLQDCLRIYYASTHNENVLAFVKKKYPGTFWAYYFNN